MIINSMLVLNDRLLHFYERNNIRGYNRVHIDVTTNYYEVAIKRYLPLRFHKLIKDLLNSNIHDNYLIASEILVKYDITNEKGNRKIN